MMNNKVQKKIWYAPNMKEAYGDEEIQSVLDCLNDGWLAPGKRTEQFEKEIAERFGKKYGVMVNSGSSANLLALACLNFQHGDEIITPACTFATTVAPIIQVGATPIFCDVEIPTYVPSIDSVLRLITKNTKAILLPNLIGIKPDWERLRKEINNLQRSDIYLIEDSCDTITHTQVTDISTTSFYASHIITAGGGGGMLMFNDVKLMKKALMIRDWGRIGNNSEEIKERFCEEVDGISYDFKFLYGAIGYNFKSTEMNAAFGLAQIKKLDSFQKIRMRNMKTYLRLLKDVPDLVLPDSNDKECSELLAMPFLYKHRNQLLEYLEDNNVQTRVCFAGNITRHPAYRQFFKEYPNADRIMEEGFLLGGHHGLNEEDIEYVCDLIINFKPKL